MNAFQRKNPPKVNNRFSLAKSDQFGGVLLLILIAVALFAALTYAITSSSRGGGNDQAKSDEMQAAYGEILNVVAGMRGAFQRMAISGVDMDDGINARTTYDFTSAGYPFDNSKCPIVGTNNSCKLYHPQGGNLSFYNFLKLHPNLGDTPDNNSANFLGKGWWGDVGGAYDQGGTAAFDYIYTIRIKKSFCDFINKKLGVPSVDSFTDAGSSANPTGIGFQYQLNGVGLSSSAGGLAGQYHAPHLRGKDMGCFKSTANGGKYFFIALIYLR